VKTRLKQAVLDVASSAWGWLGMAIAWIVLPDGSTRDFVGGAIVGLLILWAVTGPLRWTGEE
jgi:multisubunit Na+/H+ antiporter MnhE subunit